MVNSAWACRVIIFASPLANACRMGSSLMIRVVAFLYRFKFRSVFAALAFGVIAVGVVRGEDFDEIGAFLREQMIWADATADVGNHFVAFHRSFKLPAKPSVATLHLFADTRYLLWINGRYVLRGPCRFDPKGPEYDTVPVSNYLKQGRNDVAVLVFGNQVSNGRMMAHVPGLAASLVAVDAAGRRVEISTNRTWRWTDKTRHLAPEISWSGVADVMDARRESADWTEQDFNDSSWKSAVFIDSSSWGPLTARRTPLEQEVGLTPKPINAGPLPVRLRRGEHITFDIGQMAQAYVIMEFEATEGSHVDVTQAERLIDGKLANSCVHNCIAKAGRQTFMNTETIGCHYIDVQVHSGDVQLLSLGVVDRRFPYVDAGRFASSDPFLNQLWARAQHTLRMCADDAYMDCATRGRAEWMGDAAVVEYPTTRVMFAGPVAEGDTAHSDSTLIKSAIRHMAQSQSTDGRIKAHHPSDRWDTNGFIEDYSCLWVQALFQYYQNTGDVAFAKEMWPVMAKQMHWFLAQRSPEGLVRGREFAMFDNPLKYQTGEGATLNAFVYRALLDAAQLGDLVGEKDRAVFCRDAAEGIAKSFNRHLWNETEGTYSGGIFGGKLQAPTVHAALVALNRDIVPAARKERVQAWLFAHYLTAIASPYTSFWLLEELYRESRDVEALNFVRKNWASMLAVADTDTLMESFTGGEPCHNFGASPAYFLSAYVLGVRLNGPISEHRILIEPRLADLESVTGSVVTELGVVPVSWKRKLENKGLDFHFEVPPNTTAMVHIPLYDGVTKVVLNDLVVMTEGNPEKGATIQGGYLAIALGPGEYAGAASTP